MFGLTAQETNVLLKNEGFLDGSPGAYSVTEKGAKYADEQDHHRGTGGYGWYNRDWSTRTWDESIINELDVSDEKKRRVREQVAEARQARTRAVEERTDAEQPEGADNREFDMRPLLVVAGVLATGFGIYKAAPHITRFYNDKIAPRFKRRDDLTEPDETDPGDHAPTG